MVKKVSGLSLDSFFTLYLHQFKGHDWQWKIPTDTYLKYKRKYRLKENTLESSKKFVTSKEPNLNKILNDLGQNSIGLKWKKDKVSVAELVVDFVHQFPYQKRSPSYIKYPIEMLCEYGGNCVDATVLGASLLEIANIETCFIEFFDHMALGINVPYSGEHVELNGKKFYVTEMANIRWLNQDYKFEIGGGVGRDVSKGKYY
jgi:hypothetical protein